MQCPLGESQEQAPLLLLDLIDLQAQHHLQHREPDEGRAPLVLLPDPVMPERVFVRSASAAWFVSLTWLPALSSWMSEGQFPLASALRDPEWGNVSAEKHFHREETVPLQLALWTLLCVQIKCCVAAASGIAFMPFTFNCQHSM